MLSQYFVSRANTRLKNNLINYKNYHFTSQFIYLGYSSLVLHGHRPYERMNINNNYINYMILNISKWALFPKKKLCFIKLDNITNSVHFRPIKC